MNKIAIADLRPTQLTLGLSEVSRRAAKIAKMSADERETYLERKSIPHIIGPGKCLYMVDHHHLARALWSLKIREAALGEQLGDWSDLETRPFWRKMEAKGYFWPIDADGNRRPYAAIPRHVTDLTDNVWRSLARRVRGEAFTDLDTPFQEFIWGDYFRTFMSRRLIELEFNQAAELATKLARLDEAQDLPGFLG
ncbi:ParB-like protein [Rhodoblastus sp. 17X3]|uniref:ParB-like protein n=1 Tax=Rhodoblastus sp. 17X3 TaxID=3047026 RepID=UPI0024B76AF2|nr:ParB-like protein [Rhodoblastus sp. 17X3]MDI9846568.1 ParB-like protein [Rhodoblastus sp. 17X3]